MDSNGNRRFTPPPIERELDWAEWLLGIWPLWLIPLTIVTVSLIGYGLLLAFAWCFFQGFERAFDA